MRKEIALALIAMLLFISSISIGMNLPESSSPILRNNYKIIFFHLPSAITSFLAFTVTLISAILFLLKSDYRFDIIAKNSAKAGFFFITAALISGSIWASVAWGSYWNWDPRETTVLILWFVYAAYFALRESLENIDEKARFSAIYSIFAYVTIPLSYLSSKIFFSLHPQIEEMDVSIALPLLLAIASFVLLYICYLIVNCKLDEIESRIY